LSGFLRGEHRGENLAEWALKELTEGQKSDESENLGSSKGRMSPENLKPRKI
jgi:hypothetical protein